MAILTTVHAQLARGRQERLISGPENDSLGSPGPRGGGSQTVRSPQQRTAAWGLPPPRGGGGGGGGGMCATSTVKTGWMHLEAESTSMPSVVVLLYSVHVLCNHIVDYSSIFGGIRSRTSTDHKSGKDCGWNFSYLV